MIAQHILLDRDGVINRRIPDGYVTSWERFEFLPRALDALRLLAESGYRAIVVSNQACVGKGFITADELAQLTRRFVDAVLNNGGRICDVYYCPHRPEDRCRCRKPSPGLLRRAQREHGFVFAQTFLIGDSERDLMAAHEVGCPAVLVADGMSSDFHAHSVPHRPRATVRDLYQAVQFILGEKTGPRTSTRRLSCTEKQGGRMTTPNDLTSRVEQRVRESMAVKEALLRDKKLVGLIAEVGRDWAEALRGGHRTFLFGNGGSAADAQHIAAELVSRYLRDRPGLPVVALTVNTSSLTAIANDYSYDAVFARQLEALGRAGDMAIGISTSGNSRNVLLAIETAKRKGMTSVGLTGQGGGQLRGLVDRCICVPSGETPRVQESHILIGHILCEIVERELFGDSGTQAPFAAQSEPGCGSGPSHDGQAREGRNPAKTGP